LSEFVCVHAGVSAAAWSLNEGWTPAILHKCCWGEWWRVCFYYTVSPNIRPHINLIPVPNLAKYIIFSQDISVYWKRHISLCFFFAVFAEMTRLSRSQITSLWIHCRGNSRTWRKRTSACDQR